MAKEPTLVSDAAAAVAAGDAGHVGKVLGDDWQDNDDDDDDDDDENAALVGGQPIFADPVDVSASAQHAPLYLYLSHFLSAWIDRTWQFAVPMLLMLVWTETLLPAALVGMASNVATFMAMPYVGHWMDRHDRLKVMRASIVAECAACLLAAALVYHLTRTVAASGVTDRPTWTADQIGAFAVLCMANAAAEVSMRVGQQSLEKDWVLVVAQQLGAEVKVYNTRMRMIDLSCKLLGPLFFGVVVQVMRTAGIDPVTHVAKVAGTLSLVNLLAAPVEFVTVARAYNSIPALAVKKEAPRNAVNPLAVFAGGWRTYLNHKVLAPSLAYALLWFTVLDNGALMAAYLKWSGVGEGLVGASRGVGAIFGIIGTSLYPTVLRWCGEDVEKLGQRSLSVFFVHLVPIGVAFAAFGVGSQSSAALLVIVTVSRATLWTFDLALQQILQNHISESERGVVNGVHTAMCQLMLILVGAAGACFPDPRSFPNLVFISLASVLLATAIFTRWAANVPQVAAHGADESGDDGAV